MLRSLLAVVFLLLSTLWAHPVHSEPTVPMRRIKFFNFRTLRLAIEDTASTCGDEYAEGAGLLAELSSLEAQAQQAQSDAQAGTPWRLQQQWDLCRKVYSFKQTALLSNPAIKNLEILCVKRA